MKFTLSWLKEHLDTTATLVEVRDALTMLGLNATISLALGFTVTQGLTGGSGEGHDLRQRAWKRSILSALAASQLGQARGLRRLERLLCRIR